MATREVSGWTVGFVAFAGVIMMLVGSFHAFTGLAAIIENEFFVVGPRYAYELDVTAWGWLHLIFGIVWWPRASASSAEPPGRASSGSRSPS